MNKDFFIYIYIFDQVPVSVMCFTVIWNISNVVMPKLLL